MKVGVSKLELLAVMGLMVVAVAALVMSGGGGLNLPSVVLAGSAPQVSTGGGSEPGTIVPTGSETGKVMPAIGAEGQVSFYTGTITQSGDNDFYWDNTNKRLGIGTATPLRKLHYYGDAALFQRDVDAAGFIIQRTPTNRWVFGASEDPSLGTGFSIYTYPEGVPSATPRLFLDLNGNVGIGTTSPGYKLHVETAIDEAIYGKNTSTGNYGLLGGNGYGAYGKDSDNNNYGFLGSSRYGVYGKGTTGVYGFDKTNNNYGYLGDEDYGVYGYHNSGNYGYLGGSGYGAYGHSDSDLYVGVYGSNSPSNNHGYLGSIDHGVHGQYGYSGPYGNLGSEEYGVYGSYGASGPEGYIGGELFGVYGENRSTAANTAGVHGYSPDITGVDGFSYYGTGVKGYSNNGTGVSGGSWEGDGIRGYSGKGWAGYFEGEVNVTDDLSVTGIVTTSEVTYSTTRTHYYSIPGCAFTPENHNIQYSKGVSSGDAYIVTGTGGLWSPVHLPDGAVVTDFTVFFRDNSPYDLSVVLWRQALSGSYNELVGVTSTGISGVDHVSDTPLYFATIDNVNYGYSVRAYWSTADGLDLTILGARITYTISKAE